MSPEAQRIAIAEACGFAQISQRKTTGFWIDDPGFGLLGIRNGVESPIPDYLNSLDAMNEAEESITDSQWPYYASAVSRLCSKNTPNKRWLYPDGTLAAITPGENRALAASATQRAEAFLRTLNLWRDDA